MRNWWLNKLSNFFGGVYFAYFDKSCSVMFVLNTSRRGAPNGAPNNDTTQPGNPVWGTDMYKKAIHCSYPGLQTLSLVLFGEKWLI